MNIMLRQEENEPSINKEQSSPQSSTSSYFDVPGQFPPNSNKKLQPKANPSASGDIHQFKRKKPIRKTIKSVINSLPMRNDTERSKGFAEKNSDFLKVKVQPQADDTFPSSSSNNNPCSSGTEILQSTECQNSALLRPPSLKCVDCGKVLSTPTSLKNHIAVMHQGPPKLHCPYCDFGCLMSRDLWSHVATAHSDLREFSCHLCPKAMNSKSELEEHVESHQTLDRLKELKEWKKSIQSKKIQCKFCPSIFSSWRTLRQHGAAIHHVRWCMKEDFQDFFGVD